MLLVGYECINCGTIFTFLQKMLSQVRNICLDMIPQCCGPSRSFDMKVEDEKDDDANEHECHVELLPLRLQALRPGFGRHLT